MNLRRVLAFVVRHMHKQKPGGKPLTLPKYRSIIFPVMVSAKPYHATKRVSIVAGGVLDLQHALPRHIV